MIKKNKWKLMISSIIILLPIVFGVLLWDRLPEQMATHWSMDRDADGFGSRKPTDLQEDSGYLGE